MMMMVVSMYLCNKKTHSLVLDSILWSKGGLETQLTAVIFPHTRNTLRSQIISIDAWWICLRGNKYFESNSKNFLTYCNHFMLYFIALIIMLSKNKIKFAQFKTTFKSSVKKVLLEIRCQMDAIRDQSLGIRIFRERFFFLSHIYARRCQKKSFYEFPFSVRN